MPMANACMAAAEMQGLNAKGRRRARRCRV